MQKKLELRAPEGEEFSQIEEKCKMTPEEKAYWKVLMIKPVHVSYGHLDLYLKEFDIVKDRVGVGVKRKLSFIIGKLYEELGTRLCYTPEEKYPLFEQAVAWYHKADEFAGYFTDYAIRQSEACAAAAYYRQKAGLNDEKTTWYHERRYALLREVFGEREVILVSALTPELEKIIDKEIDACGNKIYLTKTKPEKDKMN